MLLSKRLQAVAGLCTPGNRVADIGCDHAYTSIYLVENNISTHVIAMDINLGPIERARDNVAKAGYSDRIDIRRSNGLDYLKSGEVDTIMIAGMGGNLTNKILNGNLEVVKRVSELVLQPQSELHLVRRNLESIGFVIVAEDMVKDSGKFYVMMKAKPVLELEDKEGYLLAQEEHEYFGRILLNIRHPILHEYLNKELIQWRLIYDKLLIWPTESSMTRQNEVSFMIRLIEQALKYY